MEKVSATETINFEPKTLKTPYPRDAYLLAISLIQPALADHGIKIHLKHDNIPAGMCEKISDTEFNVTVNFYPPDPRQFPFNLFHEIGHTLEKALVQKASEIDLEIPDNDKGQLYADLIATYLMEAEQLEAIETQEAQNLLEVLEKLLGLVNRTAIAELAELTHGQAEKDIAGMRKQPEFYSPEVFPFLKPDHEFEPFTRRCVEYLEAVKK
jgi:hypothetical protein